MNRNGCLNYPTDDLFHKDVVLIQQAGTMSCPQGGGLNLVGRDDSFHKDVELC